MSWGFWHVQGGDVKKAEEKEVKLRTLIQTIEIEVAT